MTRTDITVPKPNTSGSSSLIIKNAGTLLTAAATEINFSSGASAVGGVVTVALGGGGGSSYDTDAQAYFTVRDTYGTPLTTQQKTDINNRVLAAKTNSYWSKLSFYLPIAGGTNATGNLINAVNPSQIFTPHGSITYANSIGGDGATGYVDTGINADGSIQNFFAFNMKTLTAYSLPFGVGGVNSINISTRDRGGVGTDSFFAFGNSGNTSVRNTNSSVLKNIAALHESSLIKLFVGTNVTSAADTAITSSGLNYWLLGVNDGGSLYGATVDAMSSASVGIGFTTADATNYLADEETFQTAKALWA